MSNVWALFTLVGFGLFYYGLAWFFVFGWGSDSLHTFSFTASLFFSHYVLTIVLFTALYAWAGGWVRSLGVVCWAPPAPSTLASVFFLSTVWVFFSLNVYCICFLMLFFLSSLLRRWGRSLLVWIHFSFFLFLATLLVGVSLRFSDVGAGPSLRLFLLAWRLQALYIGGSSWL